MTQPRVEFTLRGFTTTAWRGIFASPRWKIDSMDWNDVVRIDVRRDPGPIIEYFGAVLFSKLSSVAVYADYDGFTEFQDAVFRRWPEIKDGWTRVFMGPPDTSESATLWQAAS